MVTVGTRVIYPGDAAEKTMQLTNQDPFPNVVQVWADVNSPNSTPDDADAPFLITPPVFRMEPRSGQSVRIRYVGEGLPQDRESVFYLNFQQIPPRSEAHKSQNQLLVMLRNRLKLFYRPSGIAGTPEKVPEQLRFNLDRTGDGWQVMVDNPSGYYASFSGGTLLAGGREVPLKNGMVAPKSRIGLWHIAKNAALPKGQATIRCSLINDHGARIEITQPIMVP
ncbi:molecular chaperone [Pseudomonas sp. Milli4]|uniref:Molecular chaperone n=1 Tax=Pseudomonas schmalbachii TaxID=2816993 RepID=A0ABS3TTP0_9PSED|nr:molecular chaperone [Pseudomonas schmalbachii]